MIIRRIMSCLIIAALLTVGAVLILAHPNISGTPIAPSSESVNIPQAGTALQTADAIEEFSATPDSAMQIPRKYEDALQEFITLLLKENPAYRQEETFADTETYSGYAEIDIETASQSVLGDIAYLNVNAAPSMLREKIIRARDKIIHSTRWAINPENSYECDMVTFERLFIPKYVDLFPDWELPGIDSDGGKSVLCGGCGPSVAYYENAES